MPRLIVITINFSKLWYQFTKINCTTINKKKFVVWKDSPIWHTIVWVCQAIKSISDLQCVIYMHIYVQKLLCNKVGVAISMCMCEVYSPLLLPSIFKTGLQIGYANICSHLNIIMCLYIYSSFILVKKKRWLVMRWIIKNVCIVSRMILGP